jgi:hypothetical protein
MWTEERGIFFTLDNDEKYHNFALDTMGAK